MKTQPIHRVALSALLGTVLVACAVAQQDSEASSAPGTPSAAPLAAPPLAQPAPATASPPLMVQAPRARQFRLRTAPPAQVMPQHGLAPRLRSADGPLLGVTVTETSDGLRVDSIDDGSLAQSADVKAKDVLLRIGDDLVRSIADIQRALRAHKPGETVKVAVIRPGEGIVELSGVLPEPKTAPDADGFKGGFLGVQMAKPEDDKDAAGSGAGAGVKVAGVVPESAAWFAGLQEDDRLLAIDGKTLGSGEDLVGAVSSKEPGSFIELRYARDGSEQTTRARLGHRQPEGTVGGPFGGLPMFDDTPGQGMPGGLRLRFGDAEAEPFLFHQFGQDDDVFRRMQDPQQFFGGALKDFDLGSAGSGSQSVQIEMRDGQGTMTVTRDGKTETYTLDGNGNWVPQDGASNTSDSQAPRVRNG